MYTNFNLTPILDNLKKPALFAEGEKHFWTDPYIAQQMLKAHIDPTTDAASRKPETIQREVDWIIQRAGLGPGSRLLDVGCGPGLYCQRFAQRGLHVTGVDFSENSLAYARTQAAEAGLKIEYIHQDYRALDLEALFDAVVLINYDIGVLNDPDRDQVLRNITRALKPGGVFLFDVFTDAGRKKRVMPRTWQQAEEGQGFYAPNRHLVLMQTFHYPEADTYLDQYLVLDEKTGWKVYRIWEHCYTLETIIPVLEKAGLQLVDHWKNLAGDPLSEAPETLAVMAVK